MTSGATTISRSEGECARTRSAICFAASAASAAAAGGAATTSVMFGMIDFPPAAHVKTALSGFGLFSACHGAGGGRKSTSAPSGWGVLDFSPVLSTALPLLLPLLALPAV